MLVCHRHDHRISRSAITRKTQLVSFTAKKYCTLATRTKKSFSDRRNLGQSRPWHISSYKTSEYSMSNDRKSFSSVDARNAFITIKPKPSVMKSLMSRIAHPIAIVTSQLSGDTKQGSDHEESGQKYSQLCAMTVSSINTVTLEPEPVISFNIRRPSRSHNAIFVSGGFNVQFLTASVAGRCLGEAFSKGNAIKGFQMLDRAGISWSYSSTGLNSPLIDGDGVLACVKCRLLANKCVDIGDHTVIIATIDSISPGPKQMENESMVFSGCPGLTYVMRDFRGLGEPVPGTFKKETL